MNTTILGWMGLGPELMADGAEYMRIVGSFAFFQAISLTLSASLRSANKAIYPMLVTVVVNIVNIIGNYSLIFGKFGFPELGVEGAGYLYGIQPGSSMDNSVHNSFPQTYSSFSACLLPSFSLDRTEKSDESWFTFGG